MVVIFFFQSENRLFCVKFFDGKINTLLFSFCPSHLGELIWITKEQDLQCRSLITVKEFKKGILIKE